jgi:hypothetical protein
MNCHIERRKSFDVNGDDFAYSDILHTRSGSLLSNRIVGVSNRRH